MPGVSVINAVRFGGPKVDSIPFCLAAVNWDIVKLGIACCSS